MTTIDNYLNKYLDGTISGPELQEFRTLLENEPQLQQELRQVLDLRSLIHDDMLELAPPEFLSEGVRESVGSQFAALAVEEEEQERRRSLFFNTRLVGSLATAMVAVVLVALAPTMIDNADGVRSDRSFALTTGTPNDIDNGAPILVGSVVTAPTQSAGTENRPGRHAETHSSTVHVSSNGTSGNLTPEARSDENRTGETFAALANTDAAARDEVSRTAQIAADEGNVNNRQMPEIISGGRVISLPNMLATVTADDALQSIRANSEALQQATRSLRSDGERSTRELIAQAMRSNSTNASVDSDDPSSHRLSFGFTVGAGGLTRSSSSVSVTQKAGYASYSLNDQDRIGIEAGGSTFRYTHTSFSQSVEPVVSAKANTVGDLEVMYIGVRAGNQTYGRIGRASGVGAGGGGNAGSTDSPTNRPGAGGNPLQADKGKLDSPSLYGEPSSTVAQPPRNIEGSIHSHSYETDTAVGYGMLFYDRKVLSVNDDLNIHGRLGLGGTDGGMIFDLRAYAAFATNKNVAITVGVGGSALRDFSSNAKLNANYGVQVGAELGF